MLTRTSSFDSRLDSYKSFFDDKWASDLLALVVSSKLDSPCFDLVHNWKSISNARHLPWLMVAGLDLSLTKELQEVVPLDIHKIRIFRDRLVERLTNRGIAIRGMLKQQIQQILVELDNEACDALTKTREVTTHQQTSHWEGLLQLNEFTSSLWALERTCYCAIYYIYEAFLTACIRIKVDDPTYSIFRHDGFKEGLNEAFGRTVQQQCWSAQSVVIARYARHVLVHNCGRITDKLAKQPHTFPINNGEIQVGATHTTDLFNDLKHRVSALCKSAVAMSEFQRTTVAPEGTSCSDM